MKTRKLLFMLVTAMIMMFGFTLTANAEEAAPATKVVGVEGIGTFTVPADWSDAMYIDNCGTFWFNPTKTAYVGVATTGELPGENPPIEVFATILKRNVEATGVTIIDWQVTKYFGNDAIYSITRGFEHSEFPVEYPALHDAVYECINGYYAGNSIMQSFSGATTVEEFQSIQPVLATYQPVK